MTEALSTWSGTARTVRGAELLEEVSVGFADGQGSEPCSARMRFQAGSISKLVLTVVALVLADRGELQLEEPIRRWLTDVPAHWQAITMHQLLSHTSGLGHWGAVPGLPPILDTPPDRDDLMALIRDAALVHQPGAKWQYSGPGFVVAALVLEAATTAHYRQLATDLVVVPAEMDSTTSGEFPIGRPDVATGHQNGQPIQVHEGFAQIVGTGDIWTTTIDLIRLNHALRSGDLIKDSVARRLWTPHAKIAPANPQVDDQPIVMEAYGYGTFIGRIAGHHARINPGDNPGYQSVLAYLPDQEIDLAVLCNEEAPSVTAALRRLSFADRAERGSTAE